MRTGTDVDPDITCWYPFTRKPGTEIVKAYWDFDNKYDECFGISPGRGIFHAWAGSGGWVQMPNHGRADSVYSANWYMGFRSVVVAVASTRSYYCSLLDGTWSSWMYCGSY